MTQSSQKRKRQFTSTTESSPGGPTQSTPVVLSSDAELLTWVIQETDHSAIHSSLLSSIPTASPSDLEVLKRLLEPLVASALNPLHCVRCHQPYVERENSDWSCTIPHLEADYDTNASDDYFSYGHPRGEMMKYPCCGGRFREKDVQDSCVSAKHTTDPNEVEYYKETQQLVKKHKSGPFDSGGRHERYKGQNTNILTGVTLVALALTVDDLSESEAAEPADTFENGASEPSDNSLTMPPRKRAQSIKEKGKPGGTHSKPCLKGFLGVPMEVFSEVARHLTPPDLLALARSNKLFRSIFMSRTSLPVWKHAINNVPELPQCPLDVPAPLYASLIYSKTCSECGARVFRRMDARLRVRLCAGCRNTLTLEISEDDEAYGLIPTSDVDPKKPNSAYCLKRDFELFEQEIILFPNGPALEKWKRIRREELEDRYEHAHYLDDFLHDLEWDRTTEIMALKEERRLSIELRLYEEGWLPDDMNFPPEVQTQWNRLVLQPRPLTDRIWGNLYPKLTPLLLAGREWNTPAARLQRLEEREMQMHETLSWALNAFPPLAKVAVYWSDNPDEAPVVTEISVPFPTTADALSWPVVQRMVEVDRSAEELRQAALQATAPIGLSLADWISRVHSDLLGIWGDGRSNEFQAPDQSGQTRSRRRNKAALDATGGTGFPRFDVTFTEWSGVVATSASELSDTARLLLRGDTCFRSRLSECAFYPDIIPRPVATRTMRDGKLRNDFGQPWNPSNVEKDEASSDVARLLLERMGGSELTWPELQAMGNAFVCARCKWDLPSRWDLFVLHYSTELARWQQGNEILAKLDDNSSVTFNNRHDLSPHNLEPVASILNPAQSANVRLSHLQYGHAFGQGCALKACLACRGIGVNAAYASCDTPDPENNLIVYHLKDVHGICAPEPGVHYHK